MPQDSYFTIENVFTVKNGFKFGIGFALGSSVVYALTKSAKKWTDSQK